MFLKDHMWMTSTKFLYTFVRWVNDFLRIINVDVDVDVPRAWQSVSYNMRS